MGVVTSSQSCVVRWTYLSTELGGGGEDYDARGVAHGKAVADAFLLLAHALYQWQQVGQRFPAPCRPVKSRSLQAGP